MEAKSYFFIKRIMQYELDPKARREAFHSTIDVLEMCMRKVCAEITDEQNGSGHVHDSEKIEEFDYDEAGYDFNDDE
jgi:hypothetical protein